jgi:hypothetical protein
MPSGTGTAKGEHMNADPNAIIDRLVQLVDWAETYNDPASFIEIRRTLNNELRQTIDRFTDEVVARKLREINNES